MDGHIGKVAVSSTKGCMGHLIAAAGAVEAAVCALGIRDEIAPVNANLLQPDPDCDINIVGERSRPLRIGVAMSNCFGFGGSNSSLVLKRCEEDDSRRPRIPVQ
jgi:3-oxoacyl-(acyl-carrier-protein) synthase